ncbi:MAG: hypothetical protein H7Z41_06355 [Cytophagales bacterium]|nr:hypothetical protein [Armatimonadota bacterium]
MLDHPYTKDLMAFSVNRVYYDAYRSAARMTRLLGRPEREARDYEAAARAEGRDPQVPVGA